MPRFTQVAADLAIAWMCGELLKAHQIKRAYEEYPHEWAVVELLAQTMPFKAACVLRPRPPARIV